MRCPHTYTEHAVPGTLAHAADRVERRPGYGMTSAMPCDQFVAVNFASAAPRLTGTRPREQPECSRACAKEPPDGGMARCSLAEAIGATPLQSKAMASSPSVADLAGELQAEHAIDEQERLELRARRDVLAGFCAAQQVQRGDGVEVGVKGVADRGGCVGGYRPGRLAGPLGHLMAPSAGRRGGMGQCGLAERTGWRYGQDSSASRSASRSPRFPSAAGSVRSCTAPTPASTPSPPWPDPGASLARCTCAGPPSKASASAQLAAAAGR